MEIGIYDHQGKRIGTRQAEEIPDFKLQPIEFPSAEDGWSVPLDGGLWYILRTVPQWERQVARRLTEKRFNAYTPLVDTLMKGPRLLKRFVRRPMFPGYTFVFGDQPERLGEAKKEKGAIDFMHISLRRESFYVTLPHLVVLGLEVKAKEESAKVTERKRNHSFKRKQKVIFGDGPFAGLQGIIDALDGNGGITVVVSMFGRLTKVKNVEADEIRAA